MTLSVRDLTVAYAARPVLAGVGFDACPGQIVGVIGPNGAGKSTLLKALLGLVGVDGGAMSFAGRPLASDDLAYMPQRSDIDWDYPAVALEVVEMGGYRRAGWGGLLLRRPSGLRERALQALARLGMRELCQRQIGELSGGQRQRVLLARTLVRGEAPVLLLDEPFAAVDALTERVLWDELRRQADNGRTILVVHHELVTATRFDRVLLLGARQSAFGPPAELLRADTLAVAYGAALSPRETDDDRRPADRAAA